MRITILHLSDIQYGRHHVDKDHGREPLYPNEQYCVQLGKIVHDLDILKAEHGVSPNFIVITGDIAEKSKREEYQFAEEFLGGIADHLNIDRRYVIMVPGNHDVNRKLCQSARLMFEAENKEFKPPYFAKFKFFQDFFHQFYQDVKFPDAVESYRFTEERLFVNFCFFEEKVVFVGLNSCIDENEQGPHYGNITIQQLKKAVDNLNKFDPEKKLMRIALMHHNFIRSSSNDEENLIDADELKPILLEAGFRLVFHGHQHIPRDEIIGKGDSFINVLATGSAGLDSVAIPENSRRYQIIDIRNNHVRVYRRVFDNMMINTAGKGCWKPDLSPSQKEMFDEFTLSGADREKKKEKIENPVIVSDEGLRTLYEYTHPNAYPCPKVQMSDLDWELVEKYAKRIDPDFLEMSSDKNEIAAKLGLSISFQGKPAFHRSAILCFCQRPDYFTLEMNTESRSTFYVGNPGDPKLVNKDVFGPLSSQIAQLTNLAMQHLDTISYMNGKNVERRDVDEIEREIIRELISNAITHRDYDLKGNVQVSITPEAFEVRNPGRFPHGTSWDRFINTKPVSIPINLGITNYLKALLVFEGIGQGFKVIQNYLKEHGKDSITFEELPGPTVYIRIQRRKKSIKSEETLIRDIQPPEKYQEPKLPELEDAKATRDFFVNRDRELELACAKNAIPYLIIESPPGYGKTSLLKEIEYRHQKEGWFCIFIDTPDDVGNVYQLANYIAERSGCPGATSFLDDLETAALVLAGHLRNQVKSVKTPGAVLLLDRVDSISRKEFDSFLNGFLVAIEQNFSLRVRIARQYTGDFWEERPDVLSVLPLPPLSFKYVHDFVKSTCGEQQGIKKISAHLMNLTGGHPKCMISLLSDGVNFIGSIKKNDDLYHDTHKSLVLNVANQIRDSIPKSLQEVFEVLSFFRRLNFRLLKTMRKNGLIDYNGSLEKLERELTATYLILRRDGFLQDNTVRHFFLIHLLWEEPKRFLTLYEKSLCIYREYLQESAIARTEFIVIECLYCELRLAYYRDKKSLAIRTDLREKFFGDKGIVSKYLDILLIRNDFQDVRGDLIALLKEKRDEEFEFAVNFYLRGETFDSEPYHIFCDRVEKYLLETGSGS